VVRADRILNQRYSGAGSYRPAQPFMRSRLFIIILIIPYSLESTNIIASVSSEFHLLNSGFHPSEPARKFSTRYFLISASFNCCMGISLRGIATGPR